MSTNHRTIILYILVVSLYWSAQYLYAPTLPIYVQSKTNDLALTGLVLSMYGLWQAVARIPFGLAADWLGWRKPFIAIGLALAGLGAWVLGIADNAIGLTLGRAITGLAAATWVPLVVSFTALFPPREVVRATALLTLVNSISRIFATSVTGWLNDLGGYGLAFLLATGVAALSLILLLPIHETRRPRQTTALSALGPLLMRNDVMLPALLSLIGQYVIWATTYGFLTVLAQRMGASNLVQSAMVTAHIGVGAIGNVVTTQARRFTAHQLVLAGIVITMVGVVVAALAAAIPGLFFAVLLMGLGSGLSYPVLMGLSIAQVNDAERTIAMGIHQAVYAIGMFVGPAVSGWMADQIGIQPMFMVIAITSFALSLVGMWRLKT